MSSSKPSTPDKLAARLEALTAQLASVVEEVDHLRSELSSLRDPPPVVSSVSKVSAEGKTETSNFEAVDPVESEVLRTFDKENDEISEPAPTGPVETPLPELEAASEAEPAPEPEGEVEPYPQPESEPVPDSEPVPQPEPVPAAARATVPEAGPSKVDLETRIGTKPALYTGLGLMVVGLALMALLVTPLLAPWHKVALVYLGAGTLFGIGKVLEGRLRNFSRPMMAAGLAVAFFASFSAYFVEGMRSLPLWASLLLMFASVGGILERAERWKSESTAGLAILLGHIAAYVGTAQAETVAMVGVVFLSATALALLWRHDWLPLNLLSVIAAFSSHFLWAVRDPKLATDPDRFWLNLCFLTSYYLIFLAADVAFCHRLWRRGQEAFSRRQRVSGRSVGPTAVVLYASLVAALFQASEIYWPRIELFFYPLAVVQLLLVLYHRRREGRDQSFYATAGVTFATLGLFSSFGGLALNMTLAAEALLLLVLARRIKFWFLRPLAQAVLAVNFFHFWFSEARNLDSWATFLGAVLMAMVYFVKARLNEQWEPISPDERFSSERMGNFWKRYYTPLTVPLAHLQALAGGLLLAYQCEKFLGAPWSVVWVAVLAAVGTAAGLYLGSAPVLQGTVLLHFGIAFLLLLHQIQGLVSETSWLAAQLALPLMAVSVTAALLRARGWPRRTFVRFAVAGLVAVGLAGAAAAQSAAQAAAIPALTLGLPILTAVLLWLAVECWPPPTAVPEERAHRRSRFSAGARPVRLFAAAVTAVLLVRTLLLALPPLATGLGLLAALTVVYGAFVVWRRSPYLAFGVTLHQALLVWFALTGSLAGEPIRWWIATLGALLSVVLIATCPLCGRASLGLAALGNAILAGGMLAIMTTFPGETFQPLGLWLVPPILLFVALEIYRDSPARCPETFRSWDDRSGETLFLGMMGAPAALGAVATATVTGLILGRALPPKEALWAMLVASVVLLAATLLRNSAHLTAALLTLLGQMTFHRLLHGRELVDQPVLEWATVTVIVVAAAALLSAVPALRRGSFGWGGLAALTLGQVAIAEFLLNQRPGPPSWLWVITFAGCWLAVEQLYRGFCLVVPRKHHGRPWRDKHGRDFLWRNAMGLAVASSMVSAVLIIALTWRQFPQPVTMIYVSLGYALLFVGLMAVLKSPPMAGAFAICLTAVHPLFYFRLGTAQAAADAPGLGWIVLAVTLAAGVAAEWSFRHLDDVAKRRPAWWGAWYPYVLGFFLGALFLHALGEEIWGAPALGTPLQLALAAVSGAVAWRLQLRWLTRAAVVFSALAVLALLAAVLFTYAYRDGLLVAGLLSLAAVLLLERIVARQDPGLLSRRSPRTATVYRWVLVVLAAVLGLTTFYFSRETEGSWTTAGWSLTALMLMSLGFLQRSRIHRLTALGLFLITLVRLFVADVPSLDIFYRMLAFLALGASLVAVSFLYNRFKEKFDKWL